MSSEESSGGGYVGAHRTAASAAQQHQLLDRKRLTSGLDSSGGATGIRSGGGGGGGSSGGGEMTGLTPEFRVKFHKIMGQLETEIEKEIRRQVRLQLHRMDKQPADQPDGGGGGGELADAVTRKSHQQQPQQQQQQQQNAIYQRIKAQYKQQTNRIVSSLRPVLPSQHCQFVTRLLGHTDGVWGLAAFPRRNLVASCSADGTARVWLCNDKDSCCLIEYRGHGGSVNSVRFHPSSDILLTASGDTKAHLIRLPSHDLPAAAASSAGGSAEPCKVISEPALVLSGHHTAPVIGADFISGSEVVTGSWDRVCPMALWSAETGKLVRIYEGHEDIITGVACHPDRRLALTSSKDGYFGLWDLNMGEPVDLHLHRAHSGAVTCAAFAAPERIVSGGSDRMLRLWDMRKLSAALTTIRLDAAVNKLAVHPYYPSIAALPLDNRHVQLCHLGSGGGGGGAVSIGIGAGSGNVGTTAGVGGISSGAGASGANVGGASSSGVGGGGAGGSSGPTAVGASAAAPGSFGAGVGNVNAGLSAAGVGGGFGAGLGDVGFGGGRLLGRLPRQDGKCGHLRLASAACWGEDSHRFNLFTAGFDCQILAWKVAPAFLHQAGLGGGIGSGGGGGGGGGIGAAGLGPSGSVEM